MKIRRFVAKDMRTALAQIKEELGADAVIMSNKKIPEGVELMAAVDHHQAATVEQAKPEQSSASGQPENTQVNDNSSLAGGREIENDSVTLASAIPPSISGTNTEKPADSLSALLNRKIQQPQAANPIANSESPVSSQPKANEDDIEQQFKNFTQRLQQSNPNQTNNVQNELNSSINYDSGFEEQTDVNQLNREAAKVVSVEDFASMQKEMASIRQLLEHQMSGLMWQDMAQKDPSRAVIVSRLTHMGLTESLADQIAGYIPSNLNEEDGWLQAKSLLTQQLNTTNNDIIQRGGVVALVGPTGVGKTTTIAKLAARYAQTYGADQVAMISTDSYRIAGFEQLSTYGKIIGCQVKLAPDGETLDSLLQQFAKKRLVLIDTAGMGQRDMRLAEHLTTLIANARVRIRNYLVLAANTQQRVMQENVERFKKVPLAGCIFTKLDESLSVGEIISTSVQNGLPIGYLTDGQRVPEDIKVANAEKLVTLADKMAIKFNHDSNLSWRTKPVNNAVGF